MLVLVFKPWWFGDERKDKNEKSEGEEEISKMEYESRTVCQKIYAPDILSEAKTRVCQTSWDPPTSSLRQILAIGFVFHPF